MKKVLAIILSICFVLSLTACNNNETNSDTTSGTSQFVSTEIESSKPAESSKPTQSSKPAHTHSYSGANCTAPAKCSCGATNGSALGHSWNDATCQAPKTCSVCKKKKTEGTKVEHIVEGTACKWCKQVVVVNPNKVNTSLTYTSLGPKFYEQVPYGGPPREYDCYYLIVLWLDSGATTAHKVSRESDTNADFACTFYHNGKYYRDAASMWGNFKVLYKITESEILVTITSDYEIGKEQIIRFELLSDDSLRIKSISGTDLFAFAERGLSVGSIFYPNPHYHLL